VTKDDFRNAWKTGEYELNVGDGISVLFHKQNERAVATYKFLRNEVAKEWGRKDRETRCRDANGNLCKKTCTHSCVGKERQHRSVSLNEHMEIHGFDVIDESINIATEVENLAFWDLVNNALFLLKDEEADIIRALFGLDKPLMTLSEYAQAKDMEYFTARNLRDRAFRRFRKVAPQVKAFME